MLYKIAENYYSKQEEEFLCFETKGSVLCIISVLLFVASTILAIFSAYQNVSKGIYDF
jgi:hypothetical protein